MKSRASALSFLIGLTVVFLGYVGPARADLSQITTSDLLPDAMMLDFEAGVPGPIAGSDPLFSGFGLTNVELVGTFLSGDTLDSGVQGNALCSRNGVLTVSAPSTPIDSLESGAGFRFQLQGAATQFGLLVVDQTNHTMTFETFAGGALLDSVDLTIIGGFPNSPTYFESTQPFDEVRFLASGFNGGWCVDDLTLAGRNTPPVASCVESVNASGKNTPPAGSTTLPGPRGGENEDGFYELVGEDNEDGTAPVFVTNASGSATFGPFSSGSVVKVTEAPGRTPTAKSIGGPDSAVAAHITLDSDAFAFAVDSAGVESPLVSCLVPPLPK